MYLTNNVFYYKDGEVVGLYCETRIVDASREFLMLAKHIVGSKSLRSVSPKWSQTFGCYTVYW